MAGGRTNTERIEILESQAANLSARLDVQDIVLKGIDELLRKSVAATEGHTSKITIIEERLLVLVDLKPLVGMVTAIDKDIAILRKDVEALGKWKEDLKKERDEKTRRWWAFGPNITAAIISIFGSGIVMAISYWLNKPR